MNINGSLKNEVSKELPWLFQDLGLRITEDAFSPENFGNSFVVLESPALRVRFVRDRGQISVQVASVFDPQTWWNLEHVSEIISGKNIDPGFNQSAAALLRNNFNALVNFLGPNYQNTKRELERQAESRKRAFLKRLTDGIQ